MSETVFTKVDYDLDALIKYIGIGEIGLPDIQRPFVWKNAKVRDLFDSLYQGYPVGYLLFWQNALTDDAKTIGIGSKQKPPRLLIVDGQQRLTALFAVIKSVKVVRENYDSEYIIIAFNPLEEKFEVLDAAIKRDKTFIPDISKLWNKDFGLFKVVDNYIEGMKTIKELTDEQIGFVKDNITKLHALLTFPLTALELSAEISEEEVSEVFVRVNSKGTPLKQADFILTLMSVFWDDGRKELEEFSRKSKTPTKDTSSPFNYFIEPKPDQLLRVSVGCAFKRARLHHVYSLLRGKDLNTEKFSNDKRVEQFDLLKAAQKKVLNIQYWHEFLNCLKLAGFRSDKMISSQNNTLFAYILYLIGRTEYNIDEFRLRSIIAKWFFMAGVTGRFTGSPETAMEFDLARFRDVSDGNSFIGILENICKVTLTDDFWSVTLPNDLATSSPQSPSLYAYMASLVLLDAKGLYSNIKITELLDPATNANRKLIERHHLFPKGYLKTINLTSTRDTNQIANYAYVEYKDNLKISDQHPRDYTKELKERFTIEEISKMNHWHALPSNWESMEYKDFLEKRRELMAAIIKEGYKILTEKAPSDIENIELNLHNIVNLGESDSVEFKSTLRVNLHTNQNDPRIEHSCLKTIAGFLNTNGGTLVIGVADNGDGIGISVDNFANEDKMNLHLVNLVKNNMGPVALTNIHVHFEEYNNVSAMIVRCQKSAVPVYLKENNNVEKFFIRTGPSTTELQVSQVQEYIETRFK